MTLIKLFFLRVSIDACRERVSFKILLTSSMNGIGRKDDENAQVSTANKCHVHETRRERVQRQSREFARRNPFVISSFVQSSEDRVFERPTWIP